MSAPPCTTPTPPRITPTSTPPYATPTSSAIRVEFFDCIREEANSTANTDDDKEEDVLLIRPFATKVLRLVQPSLEFSDSPLPPVNTDMATNMFRSQEFSEHSSQNTTQTYRDQVHWSLFAMATDKVEVQLKVKQQEEVPGHKVCMPLPSCLCTPPLLSVYPSPPVCVPLPS